MSDECTICRCEGCVLRNYAECPRVQDGHRAAKAPPLSDARVERAARVVNDWFLINGWHELAASRVSCIGIAHDVLAASTADAAPAVDWQSERPGKDCKSCVESGTTCTAGNGNYPACFRPKPSWTTTRPNKKGWYWQRYVGRVKASPAHFETDVGGSVWIAHGLNTEECDVEYWPVPIPEPPTTKGEGGR